MDNPDGFQEIYFRPDAIRPCGFVHRFVAFPAFITAVVPLSTVHLSRSAGTVRAEVAKHLLFVVPYYRITVENVVSVGDDFSSGSTSKTRAGGSPSVRSEDSAFLVIEGKSNWAKVEVSPVNIEAALDRSIEFLEAPGRPDLRLFLVANWKFGVFAGGLLSLLTVFYVYLLAAPAIRRLVKCGAGKS